MMDRTKHGSRQVDMLHGPLAGKILAFAIPLIASGVLQQSFNAVDVAVIGRYSTSHAIAAVGSNGPIISILVNLFLGIAVGANVLIAMYIGRRQLDAVKRSVSTVMIVALLSGFILLGLGTSLARPILEAMEAPPDVIDLAATYLRIYFCGMPFIMIYNFGSAIMRSIGDTRRPFYSLLVATLCNLVLDWLFVAVFGMGVDGVAWATVISNAVNAGIMVCFLVREPEPVTLSLKNHSFSTTDFKKMLQIGIPAGMQGMVFSISNIFIQASINKFGADAIAGSAAALTYEAYCYYIVAAFSQATIAFTGQNYGANLPNRCKRVWAVCMTYSVVLCGVANAVIIWQGNACLGLFTSDPEVIRYGLIRFHTALAFQALASSYEVSGSYMRGLGYSVLPMLLTVVGTCVLRLAWCGVYQLISSDFATLLAIYPISWVVTGIAVISAALVIQRRVFKPVKQ
ncbi:MAG: MATE family efflux transporter [Bacteroides sp.]|nr:MATE family efflux transporter [Bacteroides sp.]MCM1379434.1 MATE family efflux transporter [Bacteroides sp.]MCM1445294.1 MATE family efflux transporter [Prevotella sp.]